MELEAVQKFKVVDQSVVTNVMQSKLKVSLGDFRFWRKVVSFKFQDFIKENRFEHC